MVYYKLTKPQLPRDLSVPHLTAGRKRLQDPEASLPASRLRKRPRTSSTQLTPEHISSGKAAIGVRQALTESNLRTLDKLPAGPVQEDDNWIYACRSRVDAGSMAASRGRAIGEPTQISGRASRSQSRRSSSRRSTATDPDREASTQRSQKTSCTAASYRFTGLGSARIYVESGLPPQEIQDRINAVVRGEIPRGREKLLTKLAKEFCDDFLKILPGAAGEDDCVELLYKTLSSIFPVDKFMHSRKAGMALCFSF